MPHPYGTVPCLAHTIIHCCPSPILRGHHLHSLIRVVEGGTGYIPRVGGCPRGKEIVPGSAVGNWDPEGNYQLWLLPSSPLTCRSKKPSSVTPIYMEPPAKEEGAVAVPAVAAAEQT